MLKKKREPLGLCCLCINRAVLTDVTGHRWCEEHRFRGDFLTFGATYKYPPLHIAPYAVAQGSFHWIVNAVAARDDCVKHLMNGIAVLYGEDVL